MPRSKYTYTNDIIPIFNVVDRPLELKEAIDFIRSEDPRTKYDLGDGHLVDYLPNNRFALPVNKDNAIASGIVKESDRDLMVDTIYLELPKRTIDKSEMMLLDMLAHFDWKRPIHFTQVYILQSLDCSTTSSSTATPTAWCRSTPPIGRCTRSAASIRIT